MPATRPEFWRAKIDGNHERDLKAVGALTTAGWRVLMVWECALRGPGRLQEAEVLSRCSGFLRTDRTLWGEIAGKIRALTA